MKRNNKICLIIIVTLLFFSYYEIKSDLRIGGIVRDILFSPIKQDNYSNLYTLLNQEIKKENEELKSMLDIDYSLTDFNEVHASIIERNTSYWLNELTINKGIKDGIVENQIVITKDGMIGKIISVSYNTSIVKLITSFTEPISVLINDKVKLLFIDNYNLYIKGINEEDNIKIGDKVITSGLSARYPKGILIGEVEEIKKEKVGYIAKVKLSANINNLKFVTILIRGKV